MMLNMASKKRTREIASEKMRHSYSPFVENCDGVSGTVAQAVGELGIPRVKVTRPVASYKGRLTLGDSETYNTALQIDIERYPRTMIARAPTATNFAIKQDTGEGSAMEIDGAQTNGDLSSIHQSRAYQVKDGEIMREVKMESLAKGYEYGRTAVPISESDQIVTKLETKAGFRDTGLRANCKRMSTGLVTLC